MVLFTRQQTFDIVVAHLRKQGCKSIDDEENCLYRGPDGLMCAAGCLIPDEQYIPEMEGCSVRAIENISARGSFNKDAVYPLLGKALLGHDLELVDQLQNIHDYVPVEFWESRFIILAEEHGLVYTPTNV